MPAPAFLAAALVLLLAPAVRPGADAAATGVPEPDEWVVLETEAGRFVIDLFEEKAPDHAANFKKLVRQGWYVGSPFHRVLPGFMAQGGGRWAEDGAGTVDVGYTLPAELRSDLRHVRGTVAAARRDDRVNPRRRSSGSQFFICLDAAPHLNGSYTIFGHVVLGMDVVDAITQGSLKDDGAVSKEDATVLLAATLVPAGTPIDE